MRTLFPLALLLLALPAVAQPSFGVRVGVNAADISDVDEDVDSVAGLGKRSRLGLTIGLTADVPFTPSLSLRPEVLYVQKGYAIEADVPSGVVDVEDFQGRFTTEIDYLEVPLMLAYTFPSSGGLEVAVEAGPTLAYKLGTGFSCSGDFDEGDCEEEDGFDEEDGLNDLDLGAAVGLTVGSGPFGVGLRYTNSLSSIVDEDATGPTEDFSPRNQVLTASLAYRFGR